jgi:hypothetical protein
VLIVIGTSPDRSEWLAASSASIGREHIVVSNWGFELGKIAWVMENTTAERFFFLQDSWVVKTPALFTLLDNTVGSVALTQDPYYFGCFAGVYERSVIEHIGVPVIETKFEAVQAERFWHESYVMTAGEPIVLFADLTDENATEVRFHNGRENLILENEYVRKYKGTWREDQLLKT